LVTKRLTELADVGRRLLETIGGELGKGSRERFRLIDERRHLDDLQLTSVDPIVKRVIVFSAVLAEQDATRADVAKMMMAKATVCALAGGRLDHPKTSHVEPEVA
jgi:hypothetical protein